MMKSATRAAVFLVVALVGAATLARSGQVAATQRSEWIPAEIANNRLAKIDDDVANRGLVQPYGLVGPVQLTPYGTATAWSGPPR